jgi:DNA repair protein RadC
MYRIKFRLKTFEVREAVTDLEICSRQSTPQIKASKDAWEIAGPIFQEHDPDREHFVVLFLNTKGRVLGYKHLSTGSLTACLVHPSEVFTAVFRFAIDNQRPAGIITCHNHPSGDPNPSQEDNAIAKRLKDGCDMLGLNLVDNIILGDFRYCSFRDSNLID